MTKLPFSCTNHLTTKNFICVPRFNLSFSFCFNFFFISCISVYGRFHFKFLVYFYSLSSSEVSHTYVSFSESVRKILNESMVNSLKLCVNRWATTYFLQKFIMFLFCIWVWFWFRFEGCPFAHFISSLMRYKQKWLWLMSLWILNTWVECRFMFNVKNRILILMLWNSCDSLRWWGCVGLKWFWYDNI